MEEHPESGNSICKGHMLGRMAWRDAGEEANQTKSYVAVQTSDTRDQIRVVAAEIQGRG